MPGLFSENDFQVTVCDLLYANYQWIPDMSFYDDYPEVQTYITKGRFTGVDFAESDIESNRRNFFCFGLMKVMPLIVQPTIYNEGQHNYNSLTRQVIKNKHEAFGMDKYFMEGYHVLTNLPGMTTVTENKVNTFIVMKNDTTLDPMLLQVPEYEPSQVVDNWEYDSQNTDRFIWNGMTLEMEDELQVTHYHSNMAGMIQLGKWFDYMREQGVYDNTRIVLVSDHGADLNHLDELIMDETNPYGSIEQVYPLLMVKDFGSSEFTISEEFMTNADVPTLAMKDLITEHRNPLHGKGNQKCGKNSS